MSYDLFIHKFSIVYGFTCADLVDKLSENKGDPIIMSCRYPILDSYIVENGVLRAQFGGTIETFGWPSLLVFLTYDLFH